MPPILFPLPHPAGPVVVIGSAPRVYVYELTGPAPVWPPDEPVEADEPTIVAATED